MSEAVEKLIQILEDDLQWHQSLAVVLENKLDAMRHYDMSRLEALTANEQQLTEAICANEKKRRQVVRQATVEFFPQNNKPATARELAKALQERQSSQGTANKRQLPKENSAETAANRLLALSDMLREVTEKVKRLNNVVSIASHKILGHFDNVFRIIAQSGRDIGLYGRSGKKSLLEQNCLVDALA
ncbi:MAG: flagellar export chaperone FlgN [Sedimentisphaerales bacterium]|nr:flagellar export chaperone FlgN [Sedimentisphaerales bacterium]